MAFTIGDFNHYYDQKLTSADVTIHYGKLSGREKTAVLKSLRTGMIPVNTYRGSGKYAKDLLSLSGAAFLAMSTRSKYKEITAYNYHRLPSDVRDELCNFVVAQHVANTLEGTGPIHTTVLSDPKKVDYEFLAYSRVTLTRSKRESLGDALIERMQPYVQSQEYKDAVAAAISVVENGQDVKFNLKH